MKTVIKENTRRRRRIPIDCRTPRGGELLDCNIWTRDAASRRFFANKMGGDVFPDKMAGEIFPTEMDGEKPGGECFTAFIAFYGNMVKLAMEV